MSIVINFFGGPDSGKSTMAARLFYELKKMGVNCDLVTEYPKDLSWEKNYQALSNQLYVFANQAYWQGIRRNKCDIIITDSPLLLSVIYNAAHTSDTFKKLVWEEFNSYQNINFYLKRGDYNFQRAGRIHNLRESIEIDNFILQTLIDGQCGFGTVNVEIPIEVIVKTILPGGVINDR